MKNDKKHYTSDELIEDMKLISDSLNMAVGKMYKLQKDVLSIIDQQQFQEFAKECNRIRTIIHLDIQNIQDAKKNLKKKQEDR